MAEMRVAIMTKINKLEIEFLSQSSQDNPKEDKLVLCAFLQVIAQIGIRNSELTPSEYNDEGENHENTKK